MAASHDRRSVCALATRCQAALKILLRAYTKAQLNQVSVWNLSVAIQDLRQAGLAEHDLHWLVRRGYAEHTTPTMVGGGRRAFCPERRRRLTTQTCAVLTERGAAWLHALAKDLLRRPPSQPETPTHDPSARELRVGALLVKRFRQPASSQELILLAFQEQGWPPAIDDPLSPKPGLSSKKHLHDTIQNLNRHQQHALIHFCGDGTGRRIRWAWRAEATPELHQSYTREKLDRASKQEKDPSPDCRSALSREKSR
jgi:hypothetical protein